MAIAPKLMSREEIGQAEYACDALLQKGGGPVEAVWRRRVLNLLGHIKALEAKVVPSDHGAPVSRAQTEVSMEETGE